MVSVVPATAAGAVRTVAAAALWPAAALAADGPPAAAAAAPPAAATAARPIPAMMSLGCRIAGSSWGLDGRGSCALNYLRAADRARVARRGATCLTLPEPAGPGRRAHPAARGRRAVTCTPDRRPDQRPRRAGDRRPGRHHRG